MLKPAANLYARNLRVPAIRAAFHLQHPDVLRELSLIQSIEWSSSKIREIRDQRLEQLLHHAWSQTDYYHEVLEDCEAVRNGKVHLDRFDKIPFLTKEIIRSQPQRLMARSLSNGRIAHKNSSSGTSGQPVQFWQDNVYWDTTIATRTYHFSMNGKALGDREMKIWGSDRDLFNGTIGLKAKLQNLIYNRKFEQCFSLSEAKIKSIVKHVNDWRPKMLWCYRDGAYAIAKYINQHQLKVQSPCAVVIGGATVYSFMIDEISKAFGAPVISAYGSREVGAAACECPAREGHHIAAQSQIIETVDSDGRAVMEREGDISITPLMNYAMPFIRYRIGDRGRLTERLCSCGRAFPLLDALTGRVIETFTNNRGEHVDGNFVLYVLGTMAERRYMQKFQAIQEKDGSITVNVVLESDTTLEAHSGDLQQITEKIQVVMGHDCTVRFVAVEDIALNPSGKYPYIISHRPAQPIRTPRVYAAVA